MKLRLGLQATKRFEQGDSDIAALPGANGNGCLVFWSLPAQFLFCLNKQADAGGQWLLNTYANHYSAEQAYRRIDQAPT